MPRDDGALLAHLSSAGIEYVVIGGWAVIAHGYVRATKDVDILNSQALSKIERGFAQDAADVGAMLARRLVDAERLLELYDLIEPELYRYPAIDPRAFRARVAHAVAPA